jgi:uncharacterized protein
MHPVASRCLSHCLRACAAVLAAMLLVACAQRPDALERLNRQQPPAAQGTDDAGLLIVHCLLPGQVRQLGAFSTSITPRRAVKVSAQDCGNSGGEFASPQTDPVGALKLWLPFANSGDADAQVTLGELVERGAGVGGGMAADPALAARWYERAMAQGNARAAVNLAALYERGAGVRRDLQRARDLMRRASGLTGTVGGQQAAETAAAYNPKPRIQLIDPPALLSTLRLRGNTPVALVAPTGRFVLTGRAESGLGIAEVRVNGEARAVDINGLFTAPVVLTDQPLALRITATDRTGASSVAEFSLLQRSAMANAANATTSIATPTTTQPTPGSQRYALVIANQNYKLWDKLDTPLADGRAVADLLRSRYGFEVTLLTDATRRQVLTALNQLRAKVDRDDDVLIYYAGHGEMDAVTARGYWIPVDGEQKNLSQWISVIDITDQLAAMRARHVLVIADSCYSGTLAGSLAPRIDESLATAARGAALERLSRQRSRVAMTSGGLEPVVDGGGGKHSLYARSLLEVLTHMQSPLEAQELHAAVSARFAFLSSRLKLPQQPQYAPIGYAGHESGDFVLSPLGLK